MSRSQPGRNFSLMRGKPASIAPWIRAMSVSSESWIPKSAPTATVSPLPPSATCSGTPRRLASSTHHVISSAARANWLPFTKSMRWRRSCAERRSWPTTRGARCSRTVWNVASAQAQPRPAPPTKPDGEMRWALYVTLAPAWFDPGEVTGGFLTPFWVLYALHDALVKPMPGNLMAPSLAASWTVSADQRVYEFKLREGLTFHNGDPFTADDVKFSWERSKGGKVLKDRVRNVEVVGASRVRFHLHEPCPDFMAFYGTLATGAGWIVPRKYVEKVGDE